jgi:hypothetical protein
MKQRAPWQRPGYRFAINWPPGFVPQLQRTREVEQSETSRANRLRRVEKGDTGTILGGLSARTQPRQGAAALSMVKVSDLVLPLRFGKGGRR